METQQSIGNKGIGTFLSFGAKTVQPEILETMLVGRQKTVSLLEQYAREIAQNGVNHQVFIVGPRGAGKTHLLRVLYYRIQDLVQTRAIVVAYFAEEEYGIAGYLDFLIRIINAFMRWYDADRAALEAQLDLLRESPASRQEYVAEQIISDYVSDKPLLILSENFDSILEALDKNGQSKLRAWLYRHNRISIIATAQAMSPDMGREDRPFYGFFSTITLKKLTFAESLELLQTLAQVENRPYMIEHLNGKGRAQVQAIHELVKGNHRLLVTFYEFLKADSVAELSVIFMKTMNDLKPYFETFIRFLPPQQQKILYYLALAKIPQKGTDIAKNCFIDTPSLTKQLSVLQRKHLVDALPDLADKRNKLYDVSEPLLRIAIEIGEQREGITSLFIDFLALYYSRDEIKTQKERFEKLYQAETDPLKKQNLSREIEARDRALHLKTQLDNDFCKQPVQESISETETTKSQEDDFVSLGSTYASQGQYAQAILAYRKAIEIKSDNHGAWFNLGRVYTRQQNYEEALQAYQKTIAIKPDYSEAWNNLGNIHFYQKQYEQAIACYQKAIDLQPKNRQAWCNLGLIYYRQNKYEKAIPYYQQATVIKPDYHSAWRDLGEIYLNQGQYEQAIKAFQQAVAIKPDYRRAWYSLGEIYFNHDQYDQSIKAYRKAIEIQPTDKDTIENLEEVITEYLKSQTANESELGDLETWLQDRTGFEIVTTYVNVYRRVVFGKEEKALYELPKEQRMFFEREILKRTEE